MKVDLKNSDFDYSIYMSKKSASTNKYVKKELERIMKLFNKMKRDFYLNTDHQDMNFIVDYIKTEIYMVSSDLSELTDCALELCYGDKKSNHDFVWQMFSDGIIYNMKKRYKNFTMPCLNENGSITFAGKRYKVEEFRLDEIVSQ
jgi:GTP:adenosylcobinamide-phosphate guanylyltransferase